MSDYSFESVESFYDSEITIALPEEEAVNPCKYKIKKCRGLLKYIQEIMGNDMLRDVKKEQMINEIENYKKKYGTENFSEAYHQLFKRRKLNKKTKENTKNNKNNFTGKNPIFISKKNRQGNRGNLESDESEDNLIQKKRKPRRSVSKTQSNRKSSSSVISVEEKINSKRKIEREKSQNSQKNNNNNNKNYQNLSDYSSYSGEYGSISYENIISSGSSNESYSLSDSYIESSGNNKFNKNNKEKVDNTNNRDLSSSSFTSKNKEGADTLLNADTSTLNDRPLWRENYLKFKKNFEKNFTNLYGKNSKLSYHIYKSLDGFVYHFRSASMYVKNPNIIRLVCGKNHCAGSGVYDIISHTLKTQHEHSQSKEEHMKYETLKKLNKDFEEEIKGLNPGEGFQIFIIKQQNKEKFLIIKDAV